MSLLFDWYESPGSQDNSEGEKKLYPRVCLRHRCTTDDICCDIVSMTTATAHRYIRQLVADGKLLNQGISRNPIYVPAPGFYGKAAVEENETEQSGEGNGTA